MFEAQELAIRKTSDPILAFLRDKIFREIPAEMVIAGGAIRDKIVGIDLKDWDVFVRFTEEDEFDRDAQQTEVYERLCGHAVSDNVIKIEGGEPYSDNPENPLQGVLEWEMPVNGDYAVIQLILHDQTPLQLLNNFDLDICRASYFDGKFTYDDRFVDCVTQKKFTPSREELKTGSSLRRWDRLNRKMQKVWDPQPKSKNTALPPCYPQVTLSTLTGTETMKVFGGPFNR